VGAVVFPSFVLSRDPRLRFRLGSRQSIIPASLTNSLTTRLELVFDCFALPSRLKRAELPLYLIDLSVRAIL
jgi:hypothetical protein